MTGCQATNPTVTKSASSTAISGGSAHWDIVIDNTGSNTVAITGIVITDAGATLDSTVPANSCTVTSSPFQCNVAANSTTTLHVSKTLPAAQCADNTISNSVTSAAMPTGTPLQVTNNANTTITVPGTAAANCLSVTKTYDSGTHSYVITVTNTGPAASVSDQGHIHPERDRRDARRHHAQCGGRRLHHRGSHEYGLHGNHPGPGQPDSHHGRDCRRRPWLHR